MNLFFWMLGAIFLSPMLVSADTPLPAPEKRTVCSRSAVFCVELNPQTRESIAYKKGSRRPLWKIKRWFRVAELADDGSTFFTGYDGINLIPFEEDKDLVMLKVFKRGKLIREYKLKELIQDFSKLESTASHKHWGIYEGLDKDQSYVIRTVEGRTLRFSAKTGHMIN